MKRIWDKILEQLRQISSDIYASVGPPAGLSQIRLLEETVGVTLPQDFCGYLSALNGQKDTEEQTRDRNRELPLLGYHPFLSISGMIETWDMMNELFSKEAEPLEWVAEDKIRPYIWRRHWIPFTEYEGSQYLILDCDPGKNGTYGQVFLWCSGMDYSEIVADSFEEFSKEILARLIEKRFEVSEFGTIEFEDHYI
ncbi:MAG: SMI1/KNR4 family protein [Lawsonibacter sp.]|nr:SMI1/KNR4 family protein [Lawsonibacter sp.]MCI9566519.1 SMI1/KNR4 family protein [Lawsonibacter sp.]